MSDLDLVPFSGIIRIRDMMYGVRDPFPLDLGDVSFPAWHSPEPDASASASWAMAQHLITRGRIGCVPGVDFGSVGEGYVGFCFARDRRELDGALASLQSTSSAPARSHPR